MVYIFYESVLTGFFSGRFGKMENYVVHYFLNINLFYLHAHFFGMLIVNRGRWSLVSIAPLVLAEMICYGLLLGTLNHYFTDYNQSLPGNFLGIDHKFIIGATYRSIFFIMISTGYVFFKNYWMEKRHAAQLRIAHLESIIQQEVMEKRLEVSKNAFMRAQVNPHLLFNALSFIHRRIRKTDEIGGDMVIHLADLMRFAIDIDDHDVEIPILEEIEQVKSFIWIFSNIHARNFYLDLQLEGDLAEVRIIPLILVTLIENMYKHGDLSGGDTPGIMSVVHSANSLEISTWNKIAPMARAHSSNRGLVNLEQRIKSVKAADSLVNFGAVDDCFFVNISIKTKKESLDYQT
ncbi:hypothetical protein ASE74_10080 [Pedobacter sp. Leaf216]|nr:hypothetical protein ASE74_10080 [Pedobacter sp. Leaf216]